MYEDEVDRVIKRHNKKTPEERKSEAKEMGMNRKFNRNRQIYFDWQMQMNMSSLEYIVHKKRPADKPLTNDSRVGKFTKRNHWVCYSKTSGTRERTYVISEEYLRTAVIGPKSDEKVFEKQFLDIVKRNPNTKFPFDDELKEKLQEMGSAFGMTDVTRIEKIKFNANTRKWKGLTFGNKGVNLSDA